MSVLIRGLSKPENCFSCPFFDVFSPTRAGGDEDYQCDLFVSLDYWQAAGKADKACPLVEIPKPHGRLIDADELMKDGWKLHKEVMRMGGYAIHEKPLNYPDIPTIIESETG